MISVACPWKPPDGTDPGSVADELKNRFEHAQLVDRISTRRFGHGDGICLLEIVLGIAPSCQCGAHETHKHVALPFVLQRRCGDVESIFKETEAVVRESDVEQVAWRQSRPQDRPILIVHHHRGAGCTLLDEVLRIRLLLGDGDAVNRDADRLEQILLQKSPRRSCRIKIRNNRIGANGFLNQRCALTPDLESILRTQTGKILLQQNRPSAVIARTASRSAAISAPSDASMERGLLQNPLLRPTKALPNSEARRKA